MVILIVHNFDFRREIQGAFFEVLCWFKQNLFDMSYMYININIYNMILFLFKALSCDGLKVNMVLNVHRNHKAY